MTTGVAVGAGLLGIAIGWYVRGGYEVYRRNMRSLRKQATHRGNWFAAAAGAVLVVVALVMIGLGS